MDSLALKGPYKTSVDDDHELHGLQNPQAGLILEQHGVIIAISHHQSLLIHPSAYKYTIFMTVADVKSFWSAWVAEARLRLKLTNMSHHPGILLGGVKQGLIQGLEDRHTVFVLYTHSPNLPF